MNSKLFLMILLVFGVFVSSALAVSAQQTTNAHSGQAAGSASGGSVKGVPSAPLAPVGSGFTYQGRLTASGNPANGQYDMQFALFDAASGGTQVAGPIIVTSQTVSSGLFTVQLDFGATAFQGSARWLEIAVRQTGGGAYATLSPRQALTAAPYALSLMPGAVISGTLSATLVVTNTGTGAGISGFSGGGSSVRGITSYGGIGVYGSSLSPDVISGYGAGVRGDSNSSIDAGVYGLNLNGGYGVKGESGLGNGVRGLSNLSAGVVGGSVSGTGVDGESASGTGVYGSSNSSYGVYGQSSSTGVYGLSSGTGYGVNGVSSSGTGVFGSGSNTGVRGQATAADGWGVYGESNTGTGARGVYGKSASGTGVYGLSTADSGKGVYGEANTGINANGVYGTSSTGIGMYGSSTASNKWGVYGEANTGTDARGVYGQSNEGIGVYGSSAGTNKWGVYGEANNGPFASGVHGESHSGSGIHGVAWASNGIGIIGEANSTSAIGVDARSDFGTGIYARGGVWAGYFQGNVYVSGTINKSAVGFKIDHPDDPANKYLYHSSVESQDMKDLYDGVAVLDARGEAMVALPSWFQSVNRDFRYQLTCIGGYAPVYIAQEIANNRFKIAGGKAGMKVSWQVTGIRHDPYAEQNRMPVEQDKPENEQGYYLHPELYGQPDSKRMDKALLMDGPGALPASPPHGK